MRVYRTRQGAMLALAVGLFLAVEATWMQAHAQRSYFVGKNGTPLLTNRPDRYRNDPEYLEVRMNFKPVVVAPRYKRPSPRGHISQTDFRHLVTTYTDLYDLDKNVVYAIIKTESNFDPYAVSRAGARGLMQLMPATAAEMQVRDVFDPAQNVAAGTQYFAKLLDLFDKNVDLALAAYNAGPGAVKKYRGIPPFPETRDYVRRVRSFASAYRRQGVLDEMRVDTAQHTSSYLPTEEASYVLYFNNGATQPADRLLDEDPYYRIEYEGRKYTIRKGLVLRVEKKA